MRTDNYSGFVIATAILGDLAILNLLYCLMLWFGRMPILEWGIIQQCVIISLCYAVVISFFGGIILYRRKIRPDQVVLVVVRNVIFFFILWLAVLAMSNVKMFFDLDYLLFVGLLLLFISGHRLMYHKFLRGRRRSGANICNVVFVGSSKNMFELYEEMELNPATGYRVVGYFDEKQNPDFPAKYLGVCSEVNDYILDNNDIKRLYCSLPSAMKDTILPIINCCENHLVRFYSVPNLRNYFHRRVHLEHFTNTPVLSIRPEPLATLDSVVIKRTFDIVFSTVFLVTLFPIILVTFGTAIKMSSPGPVFFRQKRNGLDGKEFWCYKFRSMRVNVDSDTLQASEHDPRKTKVGNLMRKTNIDELPQFINVLMGDMSIVGPRPHMVSHTETYSQLIDTYMLRHLVKPGVTGWAQVTGFRGETKELSEMEGRVKADIWYMEHWTFMLDLYIIGRTVFNVIAHKDAKAF